MSPQGIGNSSWDQELCVLAPTSIHPAPPPGAVMGTQMDRRVKCRPMDERETDRSEQPGSSNPTHAQSADVGWGPSASPQMPASPGSGLSSAWDILG